MTSRDELVRSMKVGMAETDLIATVREITKRASEIDQMNQRLVDAAVVVIDQWLAGRTIVSGDALGNLQRVVQEAQAMAKE